MMMDSSRSLSMKKNGSSSRPTSTPNNLVFDRRYGWVIDVWKDPSEEALSGGRGMFCIVPLTKLLVKAASQTITIAANNTVKVLEKPELFSPEKLQANLKRFTTFIKKPEFFDPAALTRSWNFFANPNKDDERQKLN